MPCSLRISFVVILRPNHVIQKPPDCERVLVRVGHIDFIIAALEPPRSATQASAGSSPRARSLLMTSIRFVRSEALREPTPMPSSAALVLVNFVFNKLRSGVVGTCRSSHCAAKKIRKIVLRGWKEVSTVMSTQMADVVVGMKAVGNNHAIEQT